METSECVCAICTKLQTNSCLQLCRFFEARRILLTVSQIFIFGGGRGPKKRFPKDTLVRVAWLPAPRRGLLSLARLALLPFDARHSSDLRPPKIHAQTTTKRFHRFSSESQDQNLALTLLSVQGYLAHKKTHPPRTLL